MVSLAFAILLSPALASPTTALPRWAYGYELPETPTILVDGQIRPVISETKPVPTSPDAPAALSTLPSPAELIPGFASGLSFGTGNRLSPTFLARAEAESGIGFRAKSGSAEITYMLSPTNRVQMTIYSEPTTIAASEARFAAIRAKIDRQLGAPLYALRDKDESLVLAWRRTDDSGAILTLTANDGVLLIHVMLAGVGFGSAIPTASSGR